MNILLWRFDDLCFSPTICNTAVVLEVHKNIARVLKKYDCKATFGVITQYNNCSFNDNKEYYRFVRYLNKKGHEIAAHGVCHEDWKFIKKKEIFSLVHRMRDDFNNMDLFPKTFIFPGLHTNWQALPVLRKFEFEVIVKGEHVHPVKKPLLSLLNTYFVKKYSIIFPPAHAFSTEQSYDPPVLNLPEKIVPICNVTHVMDHIWLYKQSDIREFASLVKKSKETFRWETLQDFFLKSSL